MEVTGMYTEIPTSNKSTNEVTWENIRTFWYCRRNIVKHIQFLYSFRFGHHHLFPSILLLFLWRFSISTCHTVWRTK
uniref:Uncharacterized protein n=1 Tax=Arundo donax TaxID=35708 RepID=A0A0A8Y728_ARUDO